MWRAKREYSSLLYVRPQGELYREEGLHCLSGLRKQMASPE